MLRIGAHMSAAGGVSRAVDRGLLHGCEALQVFTKNANRWCAAPLDASEIRRFRRRLEESGMRPAVSHASYLINLATTFPTLREQSIAAFVDELDRAHALLIVCDPEHVVERRIELHLDSPVVRVALEQWPLPEFVCLVAL